MAAVPFWPSLVAVIVAEPAALPATSPRPGTRAPPRLLLPPLPQRPPPRLPFAPPPGTLGATVTAATGATVTVTLAVPLCPSLVAVIVTGPPRPTPVTSPLPFTLAIALLLDCQVITRPVNGLPFASRGVAVSCTVCPCSTLTEAGLTVTEATGTVGTIFTR